MANGVSMSAQWSVEQRQEFKHLIVEMMVRVDKMFDEMRASLRFVKFGNEGVVGGLTSDSNVHEDRKEKMNRNDLMLGIDRDESNSVIGWIPSSGNQEIIFSEDFNFNAVEDEREGNSEYIESSSMSELVNLNQTEATEEDHEDSDEVPCEMVTGDASYSIVSSFMSTNLKSVIISDRFDFVGVASKGKLVRPIVWKVTEVCGKLERIVSMVYVLGNKLIMVSDHYRFRLLVMGSSSTYAALVYYSAYNTKGFGKSVSVNQFQVKDVRWDLELGGQNMELRLMDYFADEFNKQVGNGVEVRKYAKAIAKLKKQVKRTKEILSANTAAPISVESLYDDRDFRSTITREKFEELCGDLWDKSLLPVKELLKNSGLQADDIYAVELIGGATRVPKLQVKLQEYFGRKDLDKHLDAEEAVVLGAALFAANLSDGIKLNRKLGMVDGSSYSFVVDLDGPDLSKDGAIRLLLIPRMKKVPSKIFKSFNHSKDFEVSLAYNHEDLLPPGLSSPIFAQYAMSGLTEAAEKYSSRNLSSPIKTNLHFSLSRSGILALDQAEAVIQISEWIEVPKRNLTVENTTSASPNVSVDVGAKNTSEESNNSLDSDSGISNASNSSVEEPSTLDLGTERKLKKRTFKIPLKIVEKTVGPGMSLSKESFSDAKRKLEALDKKDAERRRTAELKNNLEEYIYATKEKFEASEDFEKVSPIDERQSVIKKLDEVQEWLYTDGEDATATEFQDRLNMLKTTADPIFFRFKELTARPAAVEVARQYLTELQQTIRGWETDKPWLPKDRVEELSANMNKLKTWLDEKEAEQKKTSGFSTPVFTSEEVYDKVFNLQDKAASIKRIPKPKPKVEKPVKNETETNSKNAKDSDSTPEKDSSQNDKPAGDSDSSTNEEVGLDSSTNKEANAESEPHDEL